MKKDGTPLLVYLNKEQVSDSQIGKWVGELRFIKECEVWKLVNTTLQEEARKRMFENSKNYDDILFGKAMLYTLDVQEKILNTIGKYSFLKKT